MKIRKQAKKPVVVNEKARYNTETPHSNPELFERLRGLRRKLAGELHVPPYVVFTDASLWSMCALLPKTQDEFLAVSGVGTRKAQQFGKVFVEEITSYLNART